MKVTGLILTALLVLTGCGAQEAIDATRGMPGKMDETIDEMRRTNETVRKQPVAMALENIFKPENGVVLSPIPFDIMPWAKTLGDYATTEDFIEIVYLWMKKINEVQMDLPSPTPEQIAAFDQRKNHVFVALRAICGLVPDVKVRKIVNDVIVNDARFQETAMQMLIMRADFLDKVMIKSSLGTLSSLGKIERALEYANSIDYIARLPFARDLTLKVTTFQNESLNVNWTFDPAVALTTWNDIRTAARRLEVKLKDVTGNPGLNQRLLIERRNRLNRALQTVDQKIAGWGRTP